ncbi:hypothetical protein MSUIS_02790 [Mycoplasma suis KI3806]|uniref:Uncharacterized protein n=1 Tax=Mycoplasma suis (strain KI_3806) TaxID=708248 RepID=F0V3F0_MYCS3|nr:hypothetical protein [Mycoplasma suis]CBZ40372.1 hypothetical protein MSUIS_02790 [Mycoplasma suis KI3806]
MAGKFLLPLLASVGAVAGGGSTVLFFPKKDSNVITFYKKNSQGHLDITNKNPFVDPKKGLEEKGNQIGFVTLQKDSWKYKEGSKSNFYLNLFGDTDQEDPEQTKNLASTSNLQRMVKDIDAEGQEFENSESYLDGLSGKTVLYVKGMKCDEIERNFNTENNSIRKLFNFQEGERNSENKDPIKMIPNESGTGFALWSCHKNIKTVK